MFVALSVVIIVVGVAALGGVVFSPHSSAALYLMGAMLAVFILALVLGLSQR